MFAHRRILTSLLFLVALFAYVTIAQACPGCKQALATAEGENANMVNGYFWSILFMLSMPFTLLGLFAGSMYLAVRKARREQGQQFAGASEILSEGTSEVHVHA